MSPTNLHLEALACTGQKVIIVGRDGVILLGDENGFEPVGPATLEQNFWDICVFKERVFVAASAGVFEFDLDSYELNPSPFPIHVGYKLGVNSDLMYSFGTNQIYRFDGVDCYEMPCPDNSA